MPEPIKLSDSMDLEKKVELIKKNTEEIITEDELKNLLQEKKDIKAYYGTAPTGPVHVAYFIPLSKIFDFTECDIETTILIADIHAALDDLKTPWEEIDKRAEYYKKCFELALPWKKKPTFVKGSSFQKDIDYLMDMLKVATMTTVSRATRAASEVTRMKNPKVSELIYPLMQALDEEYLDVDIQFGGMDQRHIMAFAREILPMLGYKQRVEIMTPLVASLRGPGTKMSASVPESHIKVYDKEEQIKEKINKAYCPVGEIKENPILQLCQYIIFPVKDKLRIERPSKFGGDVTFDSYNKLEKAFAEKKLHPSDLKPVVAKELAEIFSKARKYFEENEDILKELGPNFLP